MSAYSCYIELVGSREFARSHSNIYKSKIDEFLEQIKKVSNKFPEVQVYFFKNTAVIDSSQLSLLLKFSLSLRIELILSGLFLRGVFRKGKAFESELFSEEYAKNVKGYLFSDVGSELISANERFKGIGLEIDNIYDDIHDINDESIKPVTSCYLPATNSRAIVTYKDLMFFDMDNQDEEDLFQRMFKEIYKASTISQSYARLFIPLFVTLANSIDLNNKDRESIVSSKNSLLFFLLNNKFEKLPRQITGIENIYFTIISRIYDSARKGTLSPSVKKLLKEKVLGMKKVFGLIHTVPPEIMSPHIKDEIYEDVSDALL